MNVGGSHYTTSLSTLCKYEDSMLAVMFSGRYQLVRDKAGRIFIDRDGQYIQTKLIKTYEGNISLLLNYYLND